MLDKFGAKSFEANVDEACQGLKRAAEARYRSQAAGPGSSSFSP